MIPKYRFYNIKLNKIYEVVSIDCLNEQVDCILPEMNGDIFNWDWNVGVLMQSTGLKDNNDMEIFEGDVVKVKAEEHEPKMWADRYEIGVIIYAYGSFDIKTKTNIVSGLIPESNLSDIRLTFEVIGNKYEHPHLLKE